MAAHIARDAGAIQCPRPMPHRVFYRLRPVTLRAKLRRMSARGWVQAENRLTDRLLGDLPARKALRARLATLTSVESSGRFFTHYLVGAR